MVRWVVRLAGLALLLIGVGVHVFDDSSSSDSEAYEPTTVRSYVATFDVDDNGDMAVVERLAVDFPVWDRHGIFRFFDVRDPNQVSARRVPHDVTVTRDGSPEPFEMLTEGGGRYRVAKIGSAGTTLSQGVHTYEIRYRVDGVLLAGDDSGTSEFYWNLVPGGWQQPIDQARLTVRLPAAANDVRCAVGSGAVSGCEVRGEGSSSLVVRASSLPPRTPVTLQTVLDMAPPPAGDTLPWPQRFDPVLGPSLILLLVVLALAGLAAGFGYVLSRRTRESTPAFPLQYAPPDGIGPAQAAYVLHERVDDEAFVASIMQAAEKGAVTLDRAEAAWTVTDKAGAEGWAGVDPVTAGVAGLLSGPHTTFTADSGDVTAGKRLKEQMGQLSGATKDWARRAGVMSGSGIGWVGGLLVLGSVVLAGLVIFTNPVRMSALALVPGLFALGAIEVMLPGASTRRTAAGRDLWSRIGGFHRVLSTPSSVERFEFSGRQELYTAYLPWAVALGCADAWAEKYRTEMGAEPPVPAYYTGAYVGGWGGFADDMVHDFSSTLTSAISAYEATQSSSSSGGGGFSGGGGGGGGGGGSW